VWPRAVRHGALARIEDVIIGCASQRKAARAWDDGFFRRSLVPVTRADGVVVDRDEHLRPGSRWNRRATAGTDPVIMLTAGQTAVEKVLARAGPERSG
jgi:acetyl-CoA C-acetyltransferase